MNDAPPPSSRPDGGHKPPSIDDSPRPPGALAAAALTDAEGALEAVEAAEGEDEDLSPKSLPAEARAALREDGPANEGRFTWLPYAVLVLLVFLGLASFLGTLLR